jgi:hypothetical protein
MSPPPPSKFQKSPFSRLKGGVLIDSTPYYYYTKVHIDEFNKTKLRFEFLTDENIKVTLLQNRTPYNMSRRRENFGKFFHLRIQDVRKIGVVYISEGFVRPYYKTLFTAVRTYNLK